MKNYTPSELKEHGEALKALSDHRDLSSIHAQDTASTSSTDSKVISGQIPPTGGAGSRGGKVIGYTRSGKPIYKKNQPRSDKYVGFSNKDHVDAAALHSSAKFIDVAKVRAHMRAAGQEYSGTANLRLHTKQHQLSGAEKKASMSKILDDLIKAGSGEGSRGGKVIGHTSSGKPVYGKFDHKGHSGFGRDDHTDAMAIHAHLNKKGVSEGSVDEGKKHEAATKHPKRGITQKFEEERTSSHGAGLIHADFKKRSGEGLTTSDQQGIEQAKQMRETGDGRMKPDKKSALDETVDLIKAGEGSRGGKVTGHTKSGKPVYEHTPPNGYVKHSDFHHKVYDKNDEVTGSSRVQVFGKENGKQSYGVLDGEKVKGRGHWREALENVRDLAEAKHTKKSEGAEMDKFDKLLKSMGAVVGEKSLIFNEDTVAKAGDINYSTSRVGIVKSARERLYESFGVREVDIRKAYGDENVKDQHGESWHVDNDKLVHSVATIATETETHDQDSQKEAASVVAEKPKGKVPGNAVTQATKSEEAEEEDSFEKARRILTEDEFFLKAFGEVAEENEDEGEEEEEEVDEAAKEAADAEKKDAPKGAGATEKGCTPEESDLKKKAKKMESLHENSPEMAEQKRPDEEDEYEKKMKSLDDLVDLVKGGPGNGRKNGGFFNNKQAHTPLAASDAAVERANAGRDIRDKFGSSFHEHMEKLVSNDKNLQDKYTSGDMRQHMHNEADKHLSDWKAKKSSLDDLVDLVKSDTRTVVRAPNVQRQGAAPKPMVGFVKAAGKGGVIMDFGNVTGNPQADVANELLERHGDNTQKMIAADQTKEYEKALNEYVTAGEGTYMAKNTNPGVDLDTPMDTQVANEFAKGQLDVQQKRTAYAEKSLNVGGENVVATSETDAALIEMMRNAGTDLSGMTGDELVIDASNNSEIDLTA